ncbi:hypothetical protein ACFOU0_12270 [Salinicoccus sesuvii]|uniref:Uncharacterized protein n=1 Tax=Salinicoccus sesuvii TaxID=868281 RepID=A0ABV7N6W9_9STAP
MSRLNKFYVIKRSDVDDYCGPLDKGNLTRIGNKIHRGRKQDRKVSDHWYIVINQDEPYADEVIEILKRNGHWG